MLFFKLHVQWNVNHFAVKFPSILMLSLANILQQVIYYRSSLPEVFFKKGVAAASVTGV